jgi:hypothetical protein
MNFLFGILVTVGLGLMAAGLAEAVRRIRWGSRFSGGVSDVRDIMKLQELNRRTRDDIAAAVDGANNCYQIFAIIASTRFRNSAQPAFLVLRDKTWSRARNAAMSAAKKGFSDCERFLRQSTDSSILLLREAFRYGVETCMACPLAQGRPGDINHCPITETLKKEGRAQ